MFLSLIEKEGYSANDLKIFEDECKPILFKKSSISIFQCIEDGKKSGYLTSELAEDLQSNNLYLLNVEIN